MPLHLLPLDHDDGDGDVGDDGDDEDDGEGENNENGGDDDQWLCQPIRTGSLPRTCSSP